MIDLHFPRMLAEMVRLMHLDGITRISELTERIKEMNPLKDVYKRQDESGIGPLSRFHEAADGHRRYGQHHASQDLSLIHI